MERMAFKPVQPRCPNFDFCKQRDTKHHGVCLFCDTACYGFQAKKDKLLYKFKPSVHYTNIGNNVEEQRTKLSSQEQKRYLQELENKENETGKLYFYKEDFECPVCMMTTDKGVFHPTCQRHIICVDCLRLGLIEKGTSPLPGGECQMSNKNFEMRLAYYERQMIEKENLRCCPICRAHELKL